MRPVCVPCKCTMEPEKNGFEVVLMTPEPYQVFQGDKWKCPRCGHETVAGFGLHPIAESFRDDWKEYLERSKPLEVTE